MRLNLIRIGETTELVSCLVSLLFLPVLPKVWGKRAYHKLCFLQQSPPPQCQKEHEECSPELRKTMSK